MEDTEFDTALVAAALEQASLTGWRGLSLVEAARSANLPPDRVRARFPTPAAVLLHLGVMADQAALAVPAIEPSVRERLFDLVMRRFDVLQAHRDGVLAVFADLPRDPALAAMLGLATLRSMGWLLEAAGLPAHGLRGALRTQGLAAVWLYAVRAWKDDASPDLAGTMAALDRALDRAEQAAGWLRDTAPATGPVMTPAMDTGGPLPEMGIDVGVPSDSPMDPGEVVDPPPPLEPSL